MVVRAQNLLKPVQNKPCHFFVAESCQLWLKKASMSGRWQGTERRFKATSGLEFIRSCLVTW